MTKFKDSKKSGQKPVTFQKNKNVQQQQKGKETKIKSKSAQDFISLNSSQEKKGQKRMFDELSDDEDISNELGKDSTKKTGLARNQNIAKPAQTLKQGNTSKPGQTPKQGQHGQPQKQGNQTPKQGQQVQTSKQGQQIPKQGQQGQTPKQGQQTPKQGQQTPKQGQQGQTPKQGQQTPKQGQQTPKQGQQGQTPKQGQQGQTPKLGQQGQTPKLGQQTPKQGSQVGLKRPRENEENDAGFEKSNTKKIKQDTQVHNKQNTNTSGSVVSDEYFNVDAQREEEMNRRTLFIKNIPLDITEEQIKNLSPDITIVRMHLTYSKKANNTRFAHIEFKNEAAADKNYRLLQKRKFGENALIVDYVGAKSVLHQPSLTSSVNHTMQQKELDPCKLFVNGLSQNITKTEAEETLKKVFPEAAGITVIARNKDKKPFGFAFVEFTTPQQCQAAHTLAHGQKIDDRTLSVSYAFKKAIKSPATTQSQKQSNKASSGSAVPNSAADQQKTAAVTKEIVKNGKQAAKQANQMAVMDKKLSSKNDSDLKKGGKQQSSNKQQPQKVSVSDDDFDDDEDDDEDDDDDDDDDEDDDDDDNDDEEDDDDDDEEEDEEDNDFDDGDDDLDSKDDDDNDEDDDDDDEDDDDDDEDDDDDDEDDDDEDDD